jgi:hypothetical protein
MASRVFTDLPQLLHLCFTSAVRKTCHIGFLPSITPLNGCCPIPQIGHHRASSSHGAGHGLWASRLIFLASNRAASRTRRRAAFHRAFARPLAERPHDPRAVNRQQDEPAAWCLGQCGYF